MHPILISAKGASTQASISDINTASAHIEPIVLFKPFSNDKQDAQLRYMPLGPTSINSFVRDEPFSSYSRRSEHNETEVSTIDRTASLRRRIPYSNKHNQGRFYMDEFI